MRLDYLPRQLALGARYRELGASSGLGEGS